MGQNSKIEWTHHTFNPWRGCTKVSAGCKNCYAETLSKRNPSVLGEWGPQGHRAIAAESYWRQPIAWNKEAAQAGERRRVFCASLADVFEGPETMPAESWEALIPVRIRLFKLITDTPNLDWLLLTKRPENINAHALRFARDYRLPENVWIGTSVENQEQAHIRIPELLKVSAAVRFLSCEPLLGPIDLVEVVFRPDVWDQIHPHHNFVLAPSLYESGIHWVIVGGESGPHARPLHPEWARSIRDQCVATGTAFHFKQWGEYAPADWIPNPNRPTKPALTLGLSGRSVYAQIGHVVGIRSDGDVCMEKVGKKAAGRLLDGRTWDEFPTITTP